MSYQRVSLTDDQLDVSSCLIRLKLAFTFIFDVTEMNDIPSGVKRLSRYGSFAARMTALRLRRKLLRDPNPEYLSNEALSFMKEMKGIPQKFGQHLSMRSDAYHDHFSSCLDKGTPLDDEAMTAILIAEVGQGHFEGPLLRIASASVAQVYKCRLERNRAREVAIKIQYPGFDEILRRDLASVKKMVKLIAPWIPSTTTRDPETLSMLIEDLGALLMTELDFKQEAAVMCQLQVAFGRSEGVTCPKTVPGLCTEKVLTMNLVHGEPWLKALKKADLRQQKDAVERLVRAYVGMGFGANLLHADPNPGNLIASGACTPLDEITILDFGQVLREPREWWDSLYELALEARSRRSKKLPGLFQAVGFQPEQLAHLGPQLLPLSRALLRPFVTKGQFDLTTWKLGRELSKALRSGRKDTIPLTFPASMVMLQRTFHGLFYYSKNCKLKLDWFQILNEERSRYQGVD